ncbi:exopolysaccharide transport family protein [Crocinitomix catalasitica]|uniref:exopolysaccharide transport family protein n=1 Tax=Crocinitomix catalasitica TaxID=184607 RepID=UPI0004881C09|nr:polysaccharide biosynthesis tyrosine autokinase [Crocinitomix catalasitica]
MQSQDISAHNTSNKLIELKDLTFIKNIFLKNLWIILLLPPLGYLAGYVYTYRLTNIYGAKTELLLKSNETYDYQDKIYQGLGAYGVYMDVQNQIRILRSRDLVGEVIDKLDFTTSYYIVGRIKKVEVFEGLPFKAEINVLNQQLYEKEIEIEILDLESYRISYEYAGEIYTKEHLFNKVVTTTDYELKLSPQYGFSEKNIETLKRSKYALVFHSRDRLIGQYQSRLSIKNIEYTSVLELSVQDELKKRAKVYLDTFANTYVDYSKRIQLEVNENTLDNIQKQLDTLNVFIRATENELLHFKDENAILNVAKEEIEFFEEYLSYTRTSRELKEKKSSVNALLEYLKTGDDGRFLPPAFYIESEDHYIQTAVTNIREKQIKYDLNKIQVSEEHTSMINLQKEIAGLVNDAKKYLENVLGGLDLKIIETNSFIDDFKDQIRRMPKSAQALKTIERELEVNNNMYLFLLEKLTNTLIARAGIIPQVRIIENTVSTGLIYPDKTKMMRLFVLGGLLLALFIALIRQLFYARIENVEELSDIDGMNVIGGVPYLKKILSPIMVVNQPKAQVTESFRTIRSNLSYLGGERQDGIAKKVMLSSFFPGEGKTFNSSNIASLIAMGDKKVLLMDFDLHRPKVHKMFDIENTKGVSNYLIGKLGFDEIVNSNILPNLDVISAGPISPNPSELVLRDKVDELFKYAEDKYDYIIVDTPPFGLLNDTIELIKYVDVFLIIMNTKFAKRSGVNKMVNMLNKYDDVSKGYILNGIKQNKFQYYYSKYTYKYSYSYNYGYGYGYGEEYTSDKNED